MHLHILSLRQFLDALAACLYPMNRVHVSFFIGPLAPECAQVESVISLFRSCFFRKMFLVVKSRLVINTLNEQFWFFLLPLLERSDRGEML